MIHRDFIMRQVHQLAHVLARVMGLDKAAKQVDGSEWLSRATEEVTGMSLERLRSAAETELAEACSRDGTVSAELAVALADILMEDSRIRKATGEEQLAQAARNRALFLYSVARNAGGPLPIHVLSLLTD